MDDNRRNHWRNRLLSFLGGAPKDKQEFLRHVRELQKSGGYIDDRAMEMIEGVFSMSDWRIRDVMIPKNDIVGLSVKDDYQTAVALVCAKEHSRYPVFAEDGEHVLGILMAKDLLRYVGAPETFFMKNVMRAPIFEPMDKNLDAMLDGFRRDRTHMVVVADEYELPAGIITIEDVLERIVGDIEDEYDDDEDRARRIAAGASIIKGSMSVESFNALFHASLPENGADTMAGWLAAEIGKFPEQEYSHRACGFIFGIVRADDRRIYTLKVSPDDSAPDDAAAGGAD